MDISSILGGKSHTKSLTSPIKDDQSTADNTQIITKNNAVKSSLFTQKHMSVGYFRLKISL